MGRPKLNISDEERYERHKECCKKYKQKRMETDPEYKDKVRDYNSTYWRNLVKNAKETKQLRIEKELEESLKSLEIKDM